MERTVFTQTQAQRLIELGAAEEAASRAFGSASARDEAFRLLERELIAACRERLCGLIEERHRVALAGTQERLVDWLCEKEGFTQVMTPTIITSDMLDKMTITEGHPLREQIYWLDGRRCLRPMLAPNLYVVMRDLSRAVKRPVRIFEVGSCFRKETKGAQHLSEFTMLNLVEYGTVEEGEQMERLKQLARGAMAALGIEGYELKIEASDVYGETLDVELCGAELASGSFGPHFLDPNWGVFTTWVGLGIGLERAAMTREGFYNIKRVGRSVGFLDGAPLRL